VTKNITIKDIAAHANVSISTVSRVLNNGDTVTEQKRQAVLEAIKHLNYQPNLFARGLAGGSSRTIGVVTQDISSPFYDTILRGIRQRLGENDYFPIFADGHWRPNQEMHAIQTLLMRQVDGLIVLGGASTETELTRLSKKLPLIVVGRNLPSLHQQCIYLDNFSGAYEATEYLLERGHRRIVHITGLLTQPDALDRLRGYQQAIRDAGFEPDPDLVIEGDFLEPSGMLAVEMLLAQGKMFSAIFASNDQMAIGAKLALYRRRIRVPEDVSLIGFDNQKGSAYTTPPLTTVHQPSIEMGAKAADSILRLINNKAIQAYQFPADLIVRESVARHM
jgi:LacI family transcriptional regulator